jgi:hypothetical protein
MGIMKLRNRFAASALALCVLGLMSAPANAVDLVGEYDATVVSIHDFSVLNGQITSKASASAVQAAVSKMNKQLFAIKSALVAFDKDLTKNWTYLSPTSNTTYPARTTFRSYDLAAYSWYSFELSQQKAATSCYSNVATAKKCVLALHSKNQKQELAHYSAMSKQLTIMEKWRIAAGR